MIRPRSIIHLNVANFAAAVERVVDARLRERPMVVAAPHAARAAVYDMSQEAYLAGVRKGMPLVRAERICRDVKVVPPHPFQYERAMTAFFKHARPYSPLIEGGEDDGHLFLDVSGTGRLFGPPADVAWRIRKAVRADLGLDPIWSAAPNKLTAKAAARMVKPDGEYIVEAGEEEEFLKPLPLTLLPGLEREDLIVLRDFHLVLVKQAALWTPGQLSVVFGKRGAHLYRSFKGVDEAPVLPVGAKPAGVRVDHVFEEDVNDRVLIEAALYRLAEAAGAQLRRRGRAARRVAVMVEYSDGPRMVRQRSAGDGAAGDARLFSLALKALENAWRRRVRVRRIRLICDRTTYPPAQLELFPEDDGKCAVEENLLTAVDSIRARFGSGAVKTGRTLSLAGGRRVGGAA